MLQSKAHPAPAGLFPGTAAAVGSNLNVRPGLLLFPVFAKAQIRLRPNRPEQFHPISSIQLNRGYRGRHGCRDLRSKPRFKSIHRPGEARELFNALDIREHPRDRRFQLRILGHSSCSRFKIEYRPKNDLKNTLGPPRWIRRA